MLNSVLKENEIGVEIREITCQVSHVMCHVSHVSYFFIFFFQTVGASWLRVCIPASFHKGWILLKIFNFLDSLLLMYFRQNHLVIKALI